MHNAYGEVIARGARLQQAGESRADYQAALAEQFEYNAAGQMIRSNGDDGVDKVYRYNAAGQRVMEYHAAQGVTRHIYDRLGQKRRRY